MGARISKVVTKTGDEGFTSLSDGQKISKTAIRVQCLGEIDELNAQLGLLNSQLEPGSIVELITRIQHDLFDFGAELSLVTHTLLREDYVHFLDAQIEQLSDGLPALKEFILPGGSPVIAQCHIVRTVCRRSERGYVALKEAGEPTNPHSQQYLNRLSDLFFVLGRHLAQSHGHKEVYWQSSYSRIKTQASSN